MVHSSVNIDKVPVECLNLCYGLLRIDIRKKLPIVVCLSSTFCNSLAAGKIIQ